MCSNRSICGGNNRPRRSSSSDGGGSGTHYALCALGVGLIALGIVMIVWTVIPLDGEAPGSSTTPSSGNVTVPDVDDADEDQTDTTKSSTVAMVLVGVGAILLVLSICLGVRSKRARSTGTQGTTAVLLASSLPGQQEEPAVDPATFSVPSYDEVVGSDEFPVRQSNLRHSTSQLPSYEDIIAAVENEGAVPANNHTENSHLADGTSAPAQATEGPPAPGPVPARSSSRASRLLRPLRVRRIKSDKLHLKDFRLQIRSPTQNPVTIEPITPPPQYDNKTPEFE
ncbi:transmembrane protein 51b [Takifugu flavidus]|uniref:Transmembrane protein 51 n=1 Tax=Takifugu flavidus TaxID=433684 RepID=A0A5C6N6U0_9TELE|nr:transmembrane protein 51b [Takifugu flavidus]XP_056886011.1 transmembrane protein 51b [Takifugu flavidus]TWW61971.1 Transmembrane protein 51 [Takifugu flavidus]